jgi:hypothetical protein
MKSNKKKINNQYKSKKEKVLNNGYPKTFFRSIGIKPHVKANEEVGQHHFEKAILNKFGKETLPLFQDALNAPDKGIIYELCHTRLDFVKIWYGIDFPRICLVANLLQKIDIPDNKNVLDLGGGPGHIAFFMSELWSNSNITVLDKYSQIGKEWANELNEDRVNFKDGQLSDLKTIEGCKYDLIIMSRVIGNLEPLSLPTYPSAFDTSSYLESQKGKNILEGLEEIGAAVKNHLTDDGHLVIIDSWSSIRALLVAKAFEKNDLFVDIEHFDPEEISIKYSTIVFSKTKPLNSYQDLPLGLATFIKEDSGNFLNHFSDQMAEAFRTLFTGSRIVFESTFSINGLNTSFKQEVMEKNGIAIRYISTTEGVRNAIIGSSLHIPFFIKSCEEEEKILKSDRTSKMLKNNTMAI